MIHSVMLPSRSERIQRSESERWILRFVWKVVQLDILETRSLGVCNRCFASRKTPDDRRKLQ